MAVVITSFNKRRINKTSEGMNVSEKAWACFCALWTKVFVEVPFHDNRSVLFTATVFILHAQINAQSIGILIKLLNVMENVTSSLLLLNNDHSDYNDYQNQRIRLAQLSECMFC